MSDTPPQTQPSPASTGDSKMFELMKRVGTLRDGLLVLSGILYFLGYATWSLNAWRNKLGLLPAIESQYFIAGIVPALVIFVTYLLVRIGISFFFKVQIRLESYILNRPLLGLVVFLL